MLHTDIPTEQEFRGLDTIRGEICVSIYLPTTPVTREAKGDRILFKNLVTKALQQLQEAKTSKRKTAVIETALMELHDDVIFWAYVADGLAVFATPGMMQTFRLPISVPQVAEISDRFYLKPLVPLLAFPGACFVLALSQGGTRFIEATSTLAEVVEVDGLPKKMSDVIEGPPARDRGRLSRIEGKETQRKAAVGQYCRLIDRALRPILSGQVVPVVLACVEEIAATYRAHNSHPHLLGTTISGNPEQLSERQLAEKARDLAVKDARKVVRKRLKLIEERASRDLASTDVAIIARAAVRGQVATLLVDVSASWPGTIDPVTGRIAPADTPGADTYDILDELVGLTVRAGGEVLPFKGTSLPDASPVGAIFRYRA